MKNIGKINAAFPTPITVVGAMVNGKPSWFEVAWVGIGDAGVVTLSVTRDHFTCDGIRAEKKLSISLIDETVLQKADYVGIVSGKKVDKSGVFSWHKGELGAPIPEEFPVSMECSLLDIYDANGCYILLCKVENTYVQDGLLQEDGKKIDYGKFHPVLFEQQGFRYVRTGEPIGPCIAPGKLLAATLDPKK
jgi:flavin reductase (DIM6/NTAB) family NADH-FMN oxidoreductase RutF